MHRYPHCWRCDTPLIFRLSDDWFISVDEIRQPKLLQANATVDWVPEYMGKRMDDWLPTWATGTSRGAATTGCRCRSTRARVGT